MIYLRLAQTTAPIEIDCEFCSYVTPPGETFFVQETDPIHRLERMNADMEFTTMCGPCYTAIKDAAMKFKLPIEFDFQLDGLRMAPSTLDVRDF